MEANLTAEAEAYIANIMDTAQTRPGIEHAAAQLKAHAWRSTGPVKAACHEAVAELRVRWRAAV